MIFLLCWHRSIFPGSHPPSIFDTGELNFCVRNGNRWILTAISTNYLIRGSMFPQNWTMKIISNTWSSPRPISTAKLNTSRHLHLQPINLVVFKGSYLVNLVGYLISGAASCLDAFSVYPFRTSLPSCATGVTTGAPEVRPSRSSRTRDSFLQISCAHDR